MVIITYAYRSSVLLSNLIWYRLPFLESEPSFRRLARNSFHKARIHSTFIYPCLANDRFFRESISRKVICSSNNMDTKSPASQQNKKSRLDSREGELSSRESREMNKSGNFRKTQKRDNHRYSFQSFFALFQYIRFVDRQV